MDKKGAKGYWISTAKVINKELFNEYYINDSNILPENYVSHCIPHSKTNIFSLARHSILHLNP